MSYSKKKFALDLRQQVEKGFNISKIAQWAYEITIDKHREISPELYKTIQVVAVMDGGPEFEFSEEELLQFANELELES